MFKSTKIEKRYSVLSDFGIEGLKGDFFGKQYPDVAPSTKQRNDVFIVEAPKLAFQAARKALDLWGHKPSEITHIISVSCTGFMAPGIEFHLVPQLGLKNNVDRLGINFMGCFGAFKGIRVATALAHESSKHRILLVCTEICSLHIQSDVSVNSFIANALFGDGAAAVIIGCDEATGLIEIVDASSLAIPDSNRELTWEASDFGYRMGLSITVPETIRKEIYPFAHGLISNKAKFSQCDWAVHPGGKAILNGVEKACNLGPEHLWASWSVLKLYGNMSSPTILFVLKKLIEKPSNHEWILGLGFGPGLSLEGTLFRRNGIK